MTTFQLWQAAAASFRANWRRLVAFEVACALLTALALSPAVGWVLRELVRSSGHASVSNYDLVEFFLSLKGLAFLCFGPGMVVTLWQLQQGGLLILTRCANAPAPPTWLVLRTCLARLPALFQLSLLQLAGLTVALLPFGLILLGIWRGLLGEQDINYYLQEQPPRWWLAITLAGLTGTAALSVAAWLVTRWSLGLPALLHRHLTPFAALRQSWQLTRGHGVRLALAIGGFWTLLLIVGRLLDEGVDLGATRLLDTMEPRLGVMALVITALAVTSLGLGLAASVLGNSLQAIVINRFWRTLSGVESAPPDDASPASATAIERARDHRRSVGLFWLVLVAAAAGISILGRVLLDGLDLHDEVAITAHRGSSLKAPENTLAALRQAIEDGADFAEIDVQTTRDGIVVVAHDGDLMRMAGDPRKIAELSLAELRSLDIGRRFRPEFTGERVPTLVEAIAQVRGQLRLNIELKFNGPNPTLVTNVLAVLRRENFLDQCVVQSLDAAALRETARLEPTLPVGLILTKAIGDPARLGAQFLSVQVGAVTPGLLHRARRNGCDVWAWTVNDARTFHMMIERGVSNVITDRPDEMAALLRARADLSLPERLILRLRHVLL